MLIDALAARFGGTAYAVVQLAQSLARIPKISTVIVLTRRESIIARGLEGAECVRCVALPPTRRYELIGRVVWEALRLPALVAREECDVVLSMSGMLPRRPGRPLVCLLFNPVMYESPGAGNKLRRLAVRHTARGAADIVVPSHAMAELASVSIGRDCAVAPLGVDHTVFAPPSVAGDEILCVADFYEHKRHDIVLDAWRLLPAPRPKLRLVGNPAVDRETHGKLLARIETLPESDSIILEYGVSLDRLVHAYHRARIFVLPSQHESFCMPLLESLACGVPAVTRDLASLRETGRGGTSFVASDEPAQWASVLQGMIENDVGHRQMRILAVRAASQFSWDRFARAVAERF